MSKSFFINNKVFIVFVFVFSGVSFLAFDGLFENIFLVTFICGGVRLYKIIKKDSSKYCLFKILVPIIPAYLISIALLFTQSYNMHLSQPHSHVDREERAVLLVYEGESEKYSVSKGLQNIKFNKSLGDILTAPFILNRSKSEYRQVGKSIYKEDTQKVKRELDKLLSEEYKVYLSYLKDEKYVEEILIDIANDGHHKIIIVPMFLTNGSNYNNLKDRVEKMKLFNLNIDIKYTEPLWNNESITLSFAKNLENYIDDEEVIYTGIILIGEGEVGYNEGRYINAVKEDLTMRGRIKSYLIRNKKLQESKIKLGWYNKMDPSYVNQIKDLLEYGVSEIMCMIVKIAPTNIQNQTIVREIKKRIDIPSEVKINVVDGFIKTQSLIHEIKNRVEFTNLQKWN